MVQRVEVLLVDDMDGGKADETVTFSLDGVSYEIDLNKENAERLRAGLKPFVRAGRRARPGAVKSARNARTQDNRERSADIRAWARRQGINLNDRGRIPAIVIERFEAAH
ncbi:histone-like nucleoid-structuring protein Lsr2 [Actinomadura flavalba]|uniref:histone-like nucleoid-structuring protein Lsr2 n=1 Tax=Actinomadura flavalba TaxID=1120938 RepID=UPI00036E4FA1|nr:Lsr2 family protein [Actinomadura flavalba]